MLTFPSLAHVKLGVDFALCRRRTVLIDFALDFALAQSACSAAIDSQVQDAANETHSQHYEKLMFARLDRPDFMC